MKKIKICGLSRLADILAVNAAAPEYCGFIIHFAKSRRSITIETLKYLRAALSDTITPVGVFVDQSPDLVAGLLNEKVISVAQLHGSEDELYISRLRALTDAPLWQAFQVHSATDIQHAVISSADLVLLDAGQGIGKMFDWHLLTGFPRNFALAGGLNLDNLPNALDTNACLLDVSSGVETEGFKDPCKIRKFIDYVRRS